MPTYNNGYVRQKNDHPILKYAQPEDIIEAVETSNGYGRKYIEYLRKNNKLTPEKIEQFREAMIKVPSYMLPIIGITTYGFKK